MRIIGISAHYHDSAAALLIDGEIIAAAQEERFSRKKHDSALPQKAIQSCLDIAGLTASDIDVVAFYEKPFLKFERLLETYATMAPRGFTSFRRAIPIWITEKLFQKNTLIKHLNTFDSSIDWSEKLVFSEHHLSHAASAFYPSPFENAAILTMDGVGEWATTSLALGQGNQLTIQKEIHFPHSLGLLYSAFTYYTGFKVNSGEYKVMGLAPFGQPRYTQIILDNLIDLKSDGTFRLDQSFFNYATGLTMTNSKFDSLFGGPPRKSESKITQREMDLAASIQAVTEDIILRLGRSIRIETGQKNLCLAGGVALNCVANGKLAAADIFDKIWIQPAAGDAGGALGAALVAHHLENNAPRIELSSSDGMAGSYLGPSYGQADIKRQLIEAGAVLDQLAEPDLIDQTAKALAANKAVGWFQGRMEFGPRALGARSILGNPSDPETQRTLNLKVKYRESFRPFAPAILREDLSEWFDLDQDSPYMSIVAPVDNEHCLPLSRLDLERRGLDRVNAQRSDIPSVTHVDSSSRIQTVHKETNPRFHDLISRFKDITGIPILVNTSFNVRGEPIVCTPEDAFRCFMATGLDLLVIGDFMLKKELQNQDLKQKYFESLDLD
ncbi:MAG: carbamoyltransferase [Rhodospirillaceae bacterium]